MPVRRRSSAESVERRGGGRRGKERARGGGSSSEAEGRHARTGGRRRRSNEEARRSRPSACRTKRGRSSRPTRGRGGEKGGKDHITSLSSDEDLSASSRASFRSLCSESRSSNSNRRSRSPSLASIDPSGSSLGSSEDERSQRRQRAKGDHLFTRQEARLTKASLKHKLLGREGEALSQAEKACMQQDRNDKGTLATKDFTRTLMGLQAAAGGVGGGAAALHKDEVLWLAEQLKSRNGNRVRYPLIRKVLGVSDKKKAARRRERGGAGLGGARGDVCLGLAPMSPARRRGARARGGQQEDEEEEEEGLEPDPWAVRHGSVGQWMQQVASPMERKLFFDFMALLDNFEGLCGLDHDRPGETSDFRAAGATVLHLGPALKAAIKFYV